MSAPAGKRPPPPPPPPPCPPLPVALTHSRWLQGLQVDDVTLVEGQQRWVLRQEVPHSDHVV